ncbi:methylated-DNA--[bacterium]|nr:methylated-DNA--[protein]-cysteine S-methyltransferase [bacterium]
MQYIDYYNSPLGKILLTADDEGLSGVWFEGEKYFKNALKPGHRRQDLEIFKQTKKWLDIYFKGQEPDFVPKIHQTGTQFQKEVWEILKKIPYGKTITYNDIAKEIAKQRGIKKMAAQAVGGAVGHNKAAIIVPCHRVVGATGNLTVFRGGIERKIKLLELEKNDMEKFYIPKKETTL